MGKNKLFLKALLLIFAATGTIPEKDTLAASRTVYFASTSINNYYRDSTANFAMLKDIALLCTVQVLNISSTTQKINDFGLFYHTTNYDDATTKAGYVTGVDIRTIGHMASKSRNPTDQHVAYSVVKIDSGAANWTAYGNDGMTFYQPTMLPLASTLSSSGATITLPPQSMLQIIGVSHASGNAFTSTADGVEIKERKLYNFCHGMIQTTDTPAAGEPKTGFLLATGFSEYIADTPIGKTMWYGEPTGGVVTSGIKTNGTPADLQSFVVGWGQGRYWLTLSHNRDLSNNPLINTSMCRADILEGVTVGAQAQCSTSVKTMNSSWSSIPQHIASIPIIINTGKPF